LTQNIQAKQTAVQPQDLMNYYIKTEKAENEADLMADVSKNDLSQWKQL
jgi:hypothetical protein